MGHTPSPTPVNGDQVLDALAHRYRRIALSSLIERDERITLGELAENVAMGVEPARNARNGGLTERIAIQLHHYHLPKLAVLGLVEYEKNGHRMVRATSAGHDLEPLLTHEAIPESR